MGGVKSLLIVVVIVKSLYFSQIPITLHKEKDYDQEGREILKCGFKIGGGIDQDYKKSPQGYTDYVGFYAMNKIKKSLMYILFTRVFMLRKYMMVVQLLVLVYVFTIRFYNVMVMILPWSLIKKPLVIYVNIQF